jgi:lysophospholipase L1-like esterase
VSAAAGLPASRSRYAALAAATSLLSFAACLVLAEAFLRFYERRLAERRREAVDMPLFRPNPHGTGSFRLRPGLRISQAVWGTNVKLETNSHGMRWREVAREKPAGRSRIAFLGDSFTFGCWASSIERSFVGVVDGALSGGGFEVLNFGVPGYGIDDAELLIREEVLSFSPDYVIVMVYNGNDLRDTYLGLAKQTIGKGTAVLDEANLKRRVPAEHLKRGTLRPVPQRRRTRLERRLNAFAAYRLAAPLLGLHQMAVEFVPGASFTSYTFWSRYPYPEVARKARDATLRALERIHDELQPRGIRLGIATLPTRQQVYSSRESGEDFDIAFPQEFVRLFARDRQIAFLDLLPPLRREGLGRKREMYAYKDTHLDDAGHALVGRQLVEWFRCCVHASASASSESSEVQ